MSAPAADDGFAWCGELVRREDPDRWLACLFIPAPARPAVHAIYAFSLEIARAVAQVREPTLGLMRLQWWRDALAVGDGAAQANPVAAALLAAVARFDLPREPLVELIEARESDLDEAPPADVAALEAYANATSAVPMRLAAAILAPQTRAIEPAATRHAGVAYALVGLLRAYPWSAARGRLHVPRDLLAAHGISAQEALSGRAAPALLAALADMRALARSHLAALPGALEAMPPGARPACLPASLCEPYLRLMERRGYDPFTSRVERPQWRRQWTLLRAARRWR
ncbi:phytoene/squalene synthase family protein [Methylocella sp.]|uniref:phytoene/squalene synthase family protein n=1 Tax=Methylocella sp. TaxID=1978226 RepID=UPI0037837382